MRKPNILLITADEMRYDFMSCAGHPVVKTPNLDALARRGVRFTNAYTPFPVCSPARHSILSGMYASAHGVTTNLSSLPDAIPTLPERLRGAGYRTGAFGKMHFWPPYTPYGFETMRLAEQHGTGWKIDDYHSDYLAQKGIVDQWDLWDQQKPYRDEAPTEYWQSYGARPSELSDADYHTTWITDQTIRYIEDEDPRPFFIWTSFIKPHHPFDPPKPWDGMYRPETMAPLDARLCLQKPLMTAGGRDPLMGYFDYHDLTDGAYRRVAALYCATISHVDANVGRLIRTLEDRGMLENTVVIFTSDHGDYMGAYGLILKEPNIPYDYLAKAPLIAAGPGITPDQVSDELVSLIDLMPTALSMGGAEIPGHVHGMDLSSVLAGDGRLDRTACFVESADVKAVRTERYKYLYNRRFEVEELYDVTDDPGERRNLAGETGVQSVIREMREHLVRWLIDIQRRPARTRGRDLRDLVIDDRRPHDMRR